MILLTGSSGYLGSQIARELLRRGEPFRVLVRDPARLSFDAAAARCEVVQGDLRDAASLARAMRGVRRVIHTAALVKMWTRERSDFRRVNVEGLQNLLQAAADAGVERVVYTSSFIALGPSSDPGSGDALKHPGPFTDPYEQSKAEALEWRRAEGFRRFPVVALLPGVIYGPGPATEGNLVGGMIRQYLDGTFPGLLGSGEQRWSFAFNSDVAAAHLAALERGRTGEAYVLAGDNRSLNEFFRVLARLSGVERQIRHLPFAAGTLAGTLDVAGARLLGRAPRLTPGVVEIFRYDWVYSSAKAASEFGYQVTPLEEGLKKTLSAVSSQ